MRSFQIVEERIPLGCFSVEMGFIKLHFAFKEINQAFMTFEAHSAVLKLIFTEIFLHYCLCDRLLQLPNSFGRSRVVDFI